MNYSGLYQSLVKYYSVLPKWICPGYALSPLQVFVEITYHCNLSCNFCQFSQDAAGGSPQRMHGRQELSSEAISRLIGQLPARTLVSFTGGEPLVKKGFYQLLHQVSQGKKTHVFTNGTLIDDHLAGTLISLGSKNIFSPGLVLVDVSLEGGRETHNTITQRSAAYERTVGGLSSLVRHKRAAGKKYPLLEMKTVISADNVSELSGLYRLAMDLGVDYFNIMTMNTIPHHTRLQGNGTTADCMTGPDPVLGVDTQVLAVELEKIKALAAQCPVKIRTTPQNISFAEILAYYNQTADINNYTCYFPWYSMGLTAYGDVVICPYCQVGNIRHGTWKEVLNNPKARSFRRQLKKHSIFPGCSGCCMLHPKKVVRSRN
ncbi:MAG: radical SAM protein [Desulfovermiculus sp.]|nr:radical SAM protein [Desulfovermiculus sp.]